ncbi:hypothetical protein ABNG03_04490 [Halorubrum sp. RMP-47]|uniref:Zinc finger protein 330-like protein n=1 Tax=Halorubrum miltondacostae TaxID=3076378 RepID=A0ABD5M0F0_9EURY
MPDTKSGRERKGRNKRRQLENHLARRELDADDEPPEPYEERTDAEFLAESDDAAR